MTYLKAEYLNYRVGFGAPLVLIDAVHTTRPNSDLFTRDIAEAVAERSDCHCILATVSRTKADLNRPPNVQNAYAVQEYRKTINEILRSARLIGSDGTLEREFLHLSIHGMKDRLNCDIELGTLDGRSCSSEIRDQIARRLRLWFLSLECGSRNPILVVDRDLSGNVSQAVNRVGDRETNTSGYGDKFNRIQIEVARWLRLSYRLELVSELSKLVNDFNAGSLNTGG